MIRFIVITDLDGTLLDQNTYSYAPALPAIQRLKELEIPLVLCSSKTAAEIESLRQKLDLRDPFIAENGGAIYLQDGAFPFLPPGAKKKGSFRVIELGKSVSHLRGILEASARECRTGVKSFGAMGPEEIRLRTGLAGEQIQLASQREYSEPFLVEKGDSEALFAALREKGCAVSRGDRFYHLISGSDKGKAAKVLVDLYRRRAPALRAIGLGNSGNDLPLLLEADLPVLVRNPDGSWDPEALKSIPGIERTQGAGPHGWREAIERILAAHA